MEHYKLVHPEHLNHYGNLFGGHMLQWIDEFAYITANLEFPQHHFVTIGMENVVFRKGVANGEILRFDIDRTRLGTTSVTYHVKATGTRNPTAGEDVLDETHISFVSVDDEGVKRPIRK